MIYVSLFYFKDSIISDLEALLLYAGIHEKHFGCYSMLAKRFPFSIYYQVEEQRVIVHAIMDDRRDPRMHKNKLLDINKIKKTPLTLN
jgi:hypothetical protein